MCIQPRQILPLAFAMLAAGAALADQPKEPKEERCDEYYFGIVKTRDFKRAFECEMAVVEQRRNWVLISVMYLNGEGTPRDVKKAREAAKHMNPLECGVTCGVLDEVLRRHEANPGKKHRRIDYCKEIAQTTPDVNYCLGVESRKEEWKRKREERALQAGLSPESRKRLAALSQAFAKFQSADGMREYQNFREGTIRGEASAIMEKRVLRHYQAAMAAFGPKASEAPAPARSLAEADRELNAVYREIMDGLDDDIAKAQTATELYEKQRAEDRKEVKTATRDAERAWLRYAEAWKKLAESMHLDEPEVLEKLRTFLTEQRIRELKYSSIGDSGSTDPEERDMDAD
jgi:hypothetical protein